MDDPSTRPDEQPASRSKVEATGSRAWGILALLTGAVWLLLLAGGIRLDEGAIFFGLTALVLLGLFLNRRADVLLLAALLTGAMAFWIQVEPSISHWNDDASAPLFFASFGLAFALSYGLRPRTLAWAVYPAIALVGFAALLGAVITGESKQYLLPVALIAAGAILLALSFRTRRH